MVLKYGLKFDLRIISASYKFSETNDIESLKKVVKTYDKREKHRLNLIFHMSFAYIATVITIAIPLLASSNLFGLSSTTLHSDLINFDGVLLVAMSIFTALMSTFIGKFDISKQISSLSPFTYSLVTLLIAMMFVIFNNLYLGLVATTISIFLLYSLMGSFLYYLKTLEKNKIN